MAQDERYFRQLFSGELVSAEEAKKPEKSYSFYIHTPRYSLDINRDKKDESLIFVKKDNEDWIEIFDHQQTKIFSYQFENKGFDSELFRIEFKRLSPQTSILVLYYFEGISRYIEYQATARVYAITIDDNNLSTLKGFKGPSFFDEFRSLKGHYHQRNYNVYLQDLNNDSVKELIVRHRLTSDVFLYAGNGKWRTLQE